MSMCNMCAYAPTIGDSFVWLQLISSYHGVSTAKCRVRATDRGHLMMSDDFGSKTMTRKHAKRRRLSCGDREDACELLSQGPTANARPCREVLAGTPRTLQ